MQNMSTGSTVEAVLKKGGNMMVKGKMGNVMIVASHGTKVC